MSQALQARPGKAGWQARLAELRGWLREHPAPPGCGATASGFAGLARSRYTCALCQILQTHAA